MDLATIYVARHCKTSWNLEHRIQGTKDLPLCAAGRAEARANLPAMRELCIDRIVCSSAKRAADTATIYARDLHVPLHLNPGLRELDHGDWEGSRWEQLLADTRSGLQQWIADPGSVPIPHGSESVTSAQQRVVDSVKSIASAYRGETVLIVSHKHILALLQCAVQKTPLSHFARLIDDAIAPRRLPCEALAALFAGQGNSH